MEVEPGTGIDFEGDARELFYGVVAYVVWRNYVRKLSMSVVRFNCALFELRSEYLPNTSLELIMYLCSTLFGMRA
jgi:hypothetical protein